jgi:hypothetical protein
LNPERWGSLLVQENNQEEKACDKRRIIIIVITIIYKISSKIVEFLKEIGNRHNNKSIITCEYTENIPRISQLHYMGNMVQQ